MSYAQFTSSASLRSIEAQLTAFNSKLYHAGLKIIPKSTLADMNEKKDLRIYQDYAMILVDRAKALYKDDYYRLNIDNMVYVFDSSTINLCLQLCPWVRFHHDKGAFKMHTLVDVKNYCCPIKLGKSYFPSVTCCK
jgi:transposase, IS4 family